MENKPFMVKKNKDMIIKIRLYWKKKKKQHKYIEYTLDSPELIFIFSIQEFARKQKQYH